MNEIQLAYEEILNIIRKHKDNVIIDFEEIERKSKCHLFGVELKEKYGLNIEPKQVNSLEWLDLGEYTKIGMFGEKHGRTISWSDDGKQPQNELLFYISFPTGAYIFGQDYPLEFFQNFFLELKSYNPKYCDTTNKSLFFSLENAAPIFNNFKEIYKKWCDLNREDLKQRQILKLKNDLQKLQNQ